jgi:MFS family permease
MKKSWLMAIITILFGMTFAMTFLKVPPTMVLLIKEFNISLTASGLLMSIPSIAILVATIPAGILVQKIGAKNTMFVSLGVGILGNAIGALSASLSLMLVARVFDGAAFSIASVAIPPIIAMWFPPQKRGLPMAVFSLWVSIGMLIIFNVTSTIVSISSWRGVWWFITVLSVILGLLFALVLKSPKPGEGAGETERQAEAGQKVSVSEGFKLPFAWMLAIIDFLYTVMFGVFNNYYATYLQEGVKLDLGTANHIYSYATIGMIIGGIVIGFILNAINKKRHCLVLTAIMIPCAIAAFIQYQVTQAAILIPFLLVVGLIYQFIPPALFTIGPNMAPRPEMIGPVMAIITFGQSVGGIISPLIVGPVVAASGGNWSGLSLPLLGIMVLSVIVAIVLQVMSTKNRQAGDVNQPL